MHSMALNRHMATDLRQEPRDSRASDALLIQGILVNDISGFEELYRIYCPRLTRLLSKRVQRPQIVEEVMNDTLMVVASARRSSRRA
jgi:RNA polymerase sigma-70 factor (ECF subfamily)